MNDVETPINAYRHLTMVADWFAARGYIVAAAEYELKANTCLMQYAQDRINTLMGIPT